MFCSSCNCEFEGWSGRCPNCKEPLVEGVVQPAEGDAHSVSYQSLVDKVKANGGQLQIPLTTTAVSMERKWSFPYFGLGSAWAKRMQGSSKEVSIDLQAVDVGKDKKYGFPYQGFRFAWVKEMGGTIGGNATALTASKVRRERKWGFPYFGFGYAWTEEMQGTCGDQIEIDLVTTEIGKRIVRRFPYLGFGLSWIKEGMLTLKVSAA